MDIIQKAEEFAKKEYKKNDSFHQWSHIQNVLKRALEIAEQLKDVDYEVLKLAIIFHDIDYRKYETHVEASIEVAETFLKKEGYPKERIEKVKEIMLNHSSPHRRKFGEAKLLEGKIIYDADKSISMGDAEFYKKYYIKLYLDETRKLVKK
ncbi:HD domain-containing protein [archaeon]|mgnify:CR=1 FL=1|jgi:HD superfamily phosphodiesterase|nr:HD domain-containing protein [archaeon]MBT4396764.1 HD domain-containing protein [archaeon]MBT4441374.1 HD domain-containing protein [archaeon]